MIQDSCYDPELFQSEQLEGLLCPIGLGVLKDPVFDQCGHVFCTSCIQQWLKKSNLCPINKQEIKSNQLIRAIPIKNMIDNLELKQCLMKCEWKGKLDQYQSHLEKQCPNYLIKCLNQGCESLVKRSEMKEHEEKCEYKQVQCQYCGMVIIKNNLESHYDECQGKQEECKDCQELIKRCDKQHQYLCTGRLIECPIKGCQFNELKRKDLEKHLQTMDHIILLQNQIKSLQALTEIQKQQIASLSLQAQPFYLEGWKLKYQKKQESREWQTIHSISKLPKFFELSFDISNLQPRPNQWRMAIGIATEKVQTQHLWYRQKNVFNLIYKLSFMWVLGGFKCANGAEKYGEAVNSESISSKMIINKNQELSFEINGVNQGVAFNLPNDLIEQKFYLVISFINIGCIRLVNLQEIKE